MAELVVYLSAIITMVMVLKASSAASLCQCFYLCCGNYCGKVLMCLIVLTVCSCTNSEMKDTRNCRRGTISPRDPYFLEGEDIILICNRRRGRSKHLTFVRGRHSEEVPEKYITRINETAVQLRIPNVTATDIDATALSVQYRCVDKRNHSKCFDNVYVRLEYALREPVNLQCRDYNFNEMTCTWSHKVDYHESDDINITCEYRTEKTELKYTTFGGRWMTCQNLTNDSCYWDASNYPAPESDIDIRVSITNIIRNITRTITKTFNKYEIVEPGPVTRLKEKLNSTKPRCIELQWRPPFSTRSFEFNVTYVSKCSIQQEKRVFYYAENSTFGDDVEICDLVPKSDYTFNVTGRLIRKVDNGNFVGWGHSSKSVSINVMTEKDVLDVNPVSPPGLYELSTDPKSDEGNFSLKLFWVPLEECYLHDLPSNVNYKVSVNNRSARVPHPGFKAEIMVPKQNVFNVTLQAVNSVGSASFPRSFTVYKPSVYDLQPSELMIQYNRTSRDCETFAKINVRETYPDFTDIHHTLVWCEETKETKGCKKALQWKELENNTFFEFPGNLCNATYRYGLVTFGYHKGQGLYVDTGIQWETCIYQSDKVLDKELQNVKVVSQHAEEFEVEWTPYDCTVTKTYVTQYMLTYCKNKNKENCTCADSRINVNISRENSTYKVTNLEAGSHYCVIIRGMNKEGLGPVSLSSVQIEDDTTQPILSWIVGVIIPVVVLLGLAIFCSRYQLIKWYKTIKENNMVKIQQLENDDATMLPKTLNNVRYSGSEYINNTSTGTEMTSLEKQHLLIDTDDAEDDIDGYKDPNDVDAVESGYQEESISSHGIRSAGFGEESHLPIETVTINESHINQDASETGMNSKPDLDIKSFNISIEKDDDNCFEMQLLSFKGTANGINSKESDDEISLNGFIEQNEQCDDIYKEIHSGSTIPDESDDEQSETELSEVISSHSHMVEEGEKSDVSLKTQSNVLEIVTDIPDSCVDEMNGLNKACLSTVIVERSAITDHSDYEKTNTENIHKFNVISSDLDDTETDVESLNGIMNETDEPEIDGYKRTENVEGQSDFESSDWEDSEDEAVVDGYRQADEVSGIDMEDFGGYKHPDEVSGMSGSDSEVEEAGKDQSNPTDSVNLPVEFDIQDEQLKNKNGITKNGINKNGIVKNGFMHKLSDTDKTRTDSLSGSDNSITSTAGSSHGNSSSAVSYVKAGEDVDSKEENENQFVEEDLKIRLDKNGLKVSELANSLPAQ